MAFCAYIFETAHQILMIFFTDVRCYYYYFIIIIIIIIIIFKVLRLAAAVFMCFFQFGRRRETSALRACFLLFRKLPPGKNGA